MFISWLGGVIDGLGREVWGEGLVDRSGGLGGGAPAWPLLAAARPLLVSCASRLTARARASAAKILATLSWYR